jgi:hypothetical protein
LPPGAGQNPQCLESILDQDLGYRFGHFAGDYRSRGTSRGRVRHVIGAVVPGAAQGDEEVSRAD